MHRCFIGSLLVMKRGIFNRPGNKTTEHAVGNTEFTLTKNSTHVSVAGQDHACVFLRPQGDSLL
jgi:hypothetical protein